MTTATQRRNSTRIRRALRNYDCYRTMLNVWVRIDAFTYYVYRCWMRDPSIACQPGLEGVKIKRVRRVAA